MYQFSEIILDSYMHVGRQEKFFCYITGSLSSFGLKSELYQKITFYIYVF